jgi:hypothetical protein
LGGFLLILKAFFQVEIVEKKFTIKFLMERRTKLRQINAVHLDWLSSPPRADKTLQEKNFSEWLRTLSPCLNSYYEQLVLHTYVMIYLQGKMKEKRRIIKSPDYTFFRNVNRKTGSPTFPLVAVELTESKRSDRPTRDPKIQMRHITNQARIPTAIIYKNEENRFITHFESLRNNQPDQDTWMILARTIKWWRKVYEPSLADLSA